MFTSFHVPNIFFVLIWFAVSLRGADPNPFPARPMFTCDRRILLEGVVLDQKESDQYYENRDKWIAATLDSKKRIDSVFYVNMNGPFFKGAEIVCEGKVVKTLKTEGKSDLILSQSRLLWPLARELAKGRPKNVEMPDLYVRVEDDLGRSGAFKVWNWRESPENPREVKPLEP